MQIFSEKSMPEREPRPLPSGAIRPIRGQILRVNGLRPAAAADHEPRMGRMTRMGGVQDKVDFKVSHRPDDRPGC